MSDEQQPRQFAVQRIYTKDISFEAPHSPAVFTENWQPEINIGVGDNKGKVPHITGAEFRSDANHENTKR